MSMGDHIGDLSEDDRALVAEYALGLLADDERLKLAHRLDSEAPLRAELRVWRARLETLDAAFAETPAPAGALRAIEARLFGASARAGWWHSLALWRGLAAGAVAVAVVAIGLNLARPPQLAPEEYAVQLVAALQAQEGSGVEFIAFYDQGSGQVRITSLSGAAVPDHDYELWYIDGDAPAVSMGVVPIDARKEIPLDEKARAAFNPGTVLAVTLEQKGGSPTGVAQGPIVAVGKAIPI